MEIPTPDLRRIPLAALIEPELPSRSTMDDTLMDELVQSMRSLGFISAISVTPRGDRFEVVAGHRRTLAAARAGIREVPALVYTSADAALIAIQHAENRHREPLSATDEAIWFAQLLEQHPEQGTDGVAARVGEKRAYVEGRINLLHGDPHIFEALRADLIKIGVAQQLNRVDNANHRAMLLDLALRNGATVHMAAQWVGEYFAVHKPALATVPPTSPAATSGPAIVADYFTCYVCGEKTHPGNMRPVQVHDYCIQSQLDPALDRFRNRRAELIFPRTLTDARALIDQLVDRFPELLPQESPAP